ncbi:hypothetical protein [Aureibacter tunicatorum]|uniref:Chromosome segregation ATPase n=1 Tax=Aureibacter tunicatorum TaxID=866807 RepID=A0AAE3XNE6_9BACT|nr:hypothetical protein [Aureibacter tunicatorum]MDR6239705.1 chromosome segregation ATPase [Aureibacter tunicatorum]BDD04181.1 hypothetical protein AUTU_16640 [Aureibacter tunicatorum]
MKKILLGLCVMGFLFTSCGKNEKKLSQKVDSLQIQLNQKGADINYLTDQMSDINGLLDSIEMAEKIIHLNVEEGGREASTEQRLSNIKEYMKQTKSKLYELEEELKKSQGSNRNYAALVAQLRKAVDQKDIEVKNLSDQLMGVTAENKQLNGRINAMEDRLSELDLLIIAKQAELEELQAQTQDEKADLLFNQAEKTEQLAKKIHFAAKKKRNEYQVAYNLYEESYNLGNEDALSRMQALEKKIKK